MRDEYREFVQSRGVERVRIVFSDANGLARGKLLPAKKFLKVCHEGVAFPRSVLVQDIEGENSPVPGFDLASGDADMNCVPRPELLAVTPWDEGAALALADCLDPATERVLPQSARYVLERVVERLEARGLRALAASELEFYLLGGSREPVGSGRPAYSLTAAARLGEIVPQLLAATEALGLEPEACLHEYAPGQLEINFSPQDALAMGDRSFLFRQMVKEVALKNGLEGTFMAKPIEGHSGSGYHVHVSLWEGERNIFWGGPGGASAQLGTFLAGLIRYTPEFFAFCAPQVNSYRRLVAGEYVPLTASWGGDNRTVAFRLPVAIAPGAARVEHRPAGADANPYLLLAAVLGAGLLGMEENLAPPDEATREAAGPPFPVTLTESLARLERSEAACNLFGAEFVEAFLTVKRQELAKFDRTITDWELRVIGGAL